MCTLGISVRINLNSVAYLCCYLMMTVIVLMMMMKDTDANISSVLNKNIIFSDYSCML